MFYVTVILSLITITGTSLIVDIFNEKFINNGIIVKCCKSVEAITIQKDFFQNEIMISNLDVDFITFVSENVTRKTHSKFSNKLGVVLNTNCTNWLNIFKYIGTESKFRKPIMWLIITENMTTKHSISAYPIEMNSDIIIAHKYGSDFYKLYEIYNTGPDDNRILTTNNIGFWNLTLHMQESQRKDLKGIEIRCVVLVTEKIVNKTFENYLEHSTHTQVDSLHKFKFYTLLTYLPDMFNFSYKFIRTNSWGYQRNGSFDGIVGALQRREADIGGTPLFYRKDRAQFVDYVTQTWQSRPCFIFRHPKHAAGLYTIYFRPLTAHVWFCILGVLTASGIILSTMFQLKALKNSSDDRDSSSSLALLSVWGAICQQGISINRCSISVKVVLFVTFVFALTIYQYYNAIVVSTLLRELPKTIRTLEDLLKSNLKVGIEDVLYNKDFFRRTTDPIAIKLYSKKIVTDKYNNFFDPTFGMDSVKRGGFAYHVDTAIAYRIIKTTFNEKEICETNEIPLYPPQNMAVVLKKKSPYKENFIYGFRKMFESGLAHRLKTARDEPKPSCVHSPDTNVISVSLKEFSTPLIALTFGMVLSLFICFCEILEHKIVKKKVVKTKS